MCFIVLISLCCVTLLQRQTQQQPCEVGLGFEKEKLTGSNTTRSDHRSLADALALASYLGRLSNITLYLKSSGYVTHIALLKIAAQNPIQPTHV